MGDDRFKYKDFPPGSQPVRGLRPGEHAKRTYGFEPIKVVNKCHYELDKALARDIDQEKSCILPPNKVIRNLEGVVRKMLADPGGFFDLTGVNPAEIYPFLLPEIFEYIDFLQPEIRTAVVRFLLIYGLKSPYYPIPSLEEWLPQRFFREFSRGRCVEDVMFFSRAIANVGLNSLIDSLLNPDKTDFAGLKAPALDEERWQTNKKIIIDFLAKTEEAMSLSPEKKGLIPPEFLIDLTRYVSPEILKKTFSQIRRSLEKTKMSEIRDLPFVPRFLKTMFYYLLNPQQLNYLRGFTDDWIKQGIENLFAVGSYICLLASPEEKQPLTLNDVLAGIDWLKAEKRFPGITDSLKEILLIKSDRIKVDKVTANHHYYYIFDIRSYSGRRKFIFVPADKDDSNLVAAAIEQGRFFLKNDGFGPDECLQIFGAIMADSSGQAFGQALGNFAFFTTERALDYGGTKMAREEHEIHERLHLMAFDRWPKLRFFFAENPEIIEGVLYAWRDRADANFLEHIMRSPEDQLGGILASPWNTKLNAAKYSFAFLVWAYIKEVVEKFGYDLPTFVDFLEKNTEGYFGEVDGFYPAYSFRGAVNMIKKWAGENKEPKDPFSTGWYVACVLFSLLRSLDFFEQKLTRLEELFGKEEADKVRRLIEEIRENEDLYWKRIASSVREFPYLRTAIEELNKLPLSPELKKRLKKIEEYYKIYERKRFSRFDRFR